MIADAGHHHAEGLAHDHQAQKHADGGHDHRRQHQPDRGEVVELRQKDDEDQEDRRAEGLGEEGPRLGLFLILARQFPADADLVQVCRLQRSGHAARTIRRPARPRGCRPAR